jgi:hypothetical protein
VPHLLVRRGFMGRGWCRRAFVGVVVMGKPSAVYRNRMQRYSDDVWLIWSNKWGCWYRDKSQGYTADVAQAGLFDRSEATSHYTDPKLPRSYRITEPFPLSSVRSRRDNRPDRSGVIGQTDPHHP